MTLYIVHDLHVVIIFLSLVTIGACFSIYCIDTIDSSLVRGTSCHVLFGVSGITGTYLGCYVDSMDRALKHYIPTDWILTNELCIDGCKALGKNT